MSNLEIILTVISAAASICAIYFGVLNAKRNRNNDNKEHSKEEAANAVNIASIQLDLKYTRDTIERIDRKLDDIEKNQNNHDIRFARFDEHLQRVDLRLDKLEKKYAK